MHATEPLGGALLARARNAVAAAFDARLLPEPDHPSMYRPGAVFVTLNTAGRLHGCIGSLEATRALDEDVRVNAYAAAFRDPRFAPLTAAEFFATRFEVSLLEPPVPLPVRSEADAVETMRRMRGGITLSYEDRRATLLPQVWETLSDPRDFLCALKQKAGLPREFWAVAVRLERYEVTRFEETPEAIV
jgi:AmmeMemoRadiSam system protein A